jgi:hypothetical protein
MTAPVSNPTFQRGPAFPGGRAGPVDREEGSVDAQPAVVAKVLERARAFPGSIVRATGGKLSA